MGEWFLTPLGGDSPWLIFAAGDTPVAAGEYVCDRCGQPLVPCDACGRPAMCGDAWCPLCQPDG